jgi:hypothetical protein
VGVKLNSAGVRHARSLIGQGKVDRTSSWSISADDENRMLGDPPNWTQYGSWHLGADSAADATMKVHWKYPFGKGGKVFRRAIIAIKSRAAQQGATAIADAAASLLEAIDAKGQGAITHEAEPVGLEGLDCVCFSSQIGSPLAEDGATAKPLHILKWGANEPIDGRQPLQIDETFTSKLVKAFDKRKVELAIDRNHATLRGFGDPTAAGWIKAVRIEKPAAGEATKATHGVWLIPDWTPEGLRQVREGEFKYMSAALALDHETGEALPELVGAALTNTPAIHGLKVVAASAERNGRGSEMEGKDVLKELGFAMIEEAKAALDDRDAKAQEVTALKAKVVDFEAKVKTLTEQTAKAAVDAAMSQAEAAGRIPKDSDKLSEPDKKARAFARSLAEKDLVLFGQWVAAAQPVIPSPVGRLTLATPPEGDGEEGALEKEVRTYAAEHKCALGAAYEAVGAKRARVAN